jgi:hypothetical protein
MLRLQTASLEPKPPSDQGRFALFKPAVRMREILNRNEVVYERIAADVG